MHTDCAEEAEATVRYWISKVGSVQGLMELILRSYGNVQPQGRFRYKVEASPLREVVLAELVRIAEREEDIFSLQRYYTNTQDRAALLRLARLMWTRPGWEDTALSLYAGAGALEEYCGALLAPGKKFELRSQWVFERFVPFTASLLAARWRELGFGTPGRPREFTISPAIRLASGLWRQIDLAVAVGGGGFVLGCVLELLGVRVIYVHSKRRGRGATFRPLSVLGSEEVTGKTVLICENDLITGRTLRRAVGEIRKFEPRRLLVAFTSDDWWVRRYLPKVPAGVDQAYFAEEIPWNEDLLQVLKTLRSLGESAAADSVRTE